MNTDIMYRVAYFHALFYDLQSTNSIITKRYYLQGMPEDFKDDFQYILQTLDGKHPLGYTFASYDASLFGDACKEFSTIREVIEYLCRPKAMGDLSVANIQYHVSNIDQDLADFIGPIVDRTLRLGIGRSAIEKTAYQPMLAKKFDRRKVPVSNKYFITEKLDGNRCIARYTEYGWTFTSRNGKQMYVDFDMTGMPTCYVYDGEVMTRRQTEESRARSLGIKYEQPVPNLVGSTGAFSEASGLINSHSYNKDLVYNVFDIIDFSAPYEARRKELDTIVPESNDVRIIPVLKTYDRYIGDDLDETLGYIVSTGGEGLMINCNRVYTDKRTDGLLKYKPSYTADLRVVDIIPGKGKYEGLVGALHCIGKIDGRAVSCDVGSGLTDIQREAWLDGCIVGSIVEVEYFSLSLAAGSSVYSLRFPRLKKVRTDKDSTSFD